MALGVTQSQGVSAVNSYPIVAVAALPAAATLTGYTYFVSDATAPALGNTVAGGGAVKCRVFSDGTNWLVG